MNVGDFDVLHVKGDADALDFIARRQFQNSNRQWTSPPSSPSGATVPTLEGTASTIYTDLGTVGPTVTLATYSLVVVLISCWVNITATSTVGYVSVAVSGATSLAAADGNVGFWENTATGGSYGQATATVYLTGLTSGSNTFALKYKSSDGSTCNFYNRTLVVIPI